jgi:hypothetical protein
LTEVMAALPCWGAVLLILLRRRRNQIRAPISARPTMGPTTAPAIQALEPPPLAFFILSGEVSAVDTTCGIESADEVLVESFHHSRS